MKKLLALLLAMILCLGVLVACNDEPSDLELVENDEPNVEKGSTPVFPTIFKNRYTCYNVSEKQSLNGTKEKFQRWIFADRASFIEFLQENTSLTDSDEITEETFEENFVVVIYRLGDYRKTENYGYGDFRWNEPNIFVGRDDAYYSITLEYTSYANRAYDERDVPPKFDIVVVPREDGPQNLSEVAENFRIETYVHYYKGLGETIK